MEKDNEWPAWRYGPNGESDVFDSVAEVPTGWLDHPSKHVTPAKTGSEPLPPRTDRIPPAQRGSGPAAPGSQGPNPGGKPAKGATSDVSNTKRGRGRPSKAKAPALDL